MCGLLFILQNKNCLCNLQPSREKLVRQIENRGPNSQNTVEFTNDNGIHFYIHTSLLWLRGTEPCVQPDKKGENTLLWNGDLFNIDLPIGQSDTEYISNQLSEAKDAQSVRSIFSQLNGPGAYLYYRQNVETLWFGRDIFGRHSLLASIQPCHVIISSVGFMNSELIEVPALGVYELTMGTKFDINLVPWSNRLPQNEMILPFEANLDPDNALTSNVDIMKTEKIDLPDYNNFEDYLNCKIAKNAVEGLREALTISVKERVSAQPPFCKECIKDKHSYHEDSKKQRKDCLHTKVAILFSGGLDSTVLVYLAALSVQPGDQLDLLNVAFQQADGTYAVPDRLTAFQAFEELQELILPLEITLNLILVNVTKAELKDWRESQIKDLLWPLDTVLDDSIGCAIWFASRGRGQLWLNEEVSYSSPARVLLLGMGADEQLGGYSKHLRASKEGRESLCQELQRQIDAISERNLGRDNRVVSDHGVAGRFPFLDERVVNFLSNLPLELKMNLSLERGTGDKIILRAMAHTMGLLKTASEPKRAIQFGSRIAKLENRKEKASDKAIRD